MSRFLAVAAVTWVVSVAGLSWGSEYPVGGAQGGRYGSGGDEKRASPVVDVPGPPSDEVPLQFALRLNSANPAGRTVLFEADLPQATLVTVKLFDVLGRQVVRLGPRTPLAAGTHRLAIPLDAVASGTYLARVLFETVVTGESREFTRKIVHVK